MPLSTFSRLLLAGAAIVLPAMAIATNSLAKSNLREAEYQLAALGYDTGPVDGHFTRESRSALRTFQLQAGLPDTGHMNDATWAALLEVAMLRIMSDGAVDLPLPGITAGSRPSAPGTRQDFLLQGPAPGP